MESGYTIKSSQKLKADLKAITSTQARKFLLEKGYSSSSFKMPEYYQPHGFDSINLDAINWKAKTGVRITKTLDILTPKGYLSWRNFNFTHPYIFLQKVHTITESANWKLIQNKLCKETLIHSYSVPIFNLKSGETLSGKSINNWLQMAEKDLIKDCVNFHFLVVTDIKNFYPSIYTHSISWAVHTKATSKSKRGDFTLLGNKLDKLFQNSRDGQTNGIPVGSLLSDITAELILADIDEKLSGQIKKHKLTKRVIVTRFRDDYRILSKTEEDGKCVLQCLNKILTNDYDLSLNADKTKLYNDIVEGSFRPWIVEMKSSHLLRKIYYGDISDCKTTNHLKDCLIETYKIQRKYPDSRISVSILSKLAEGLFKDSSGLKLRTGDIPEVISILRKLTLLREEATPQTYILLDILLRHITAKAEKKRLLKTIYFIIEGNNDYTYQLIWFYRLCLSHLPDMCDVILRKNDIPLLRVVSRTYYKSDCEIFPPCTFSTNDTSELKKFCFINRRSLLRSKTKGIHPNSINPFKY